MAIKDRRSNKASPATYWNGEPAACRRVIVRVGTVAKVSWWCHGLEGTERAAVEVVYAGDTFFLDDDDGDGQPDYSGMSDDLRTQMNARRGRHRAGDGWRKVTEGRGAPGAVGGHRSLPTDSVVVRERTETE